MFIMVKFYDKTIYSHLMDLFVIILSNLFLLVTIFHFIFIDFQFNFVVCIPYVARNSYF